MFYYIFDMTVHCTQYFNWFYIWSSRASSDEMCSYFSLMKNSKCKADCQRLQISQPRREVLPQPQTRTEQSAPRSSRSTSSSSCWEDFSPPSEFPSLGGLTLCCRPGEVLLTERSLISSRFNMSPVLLTPHTARAGK